MLELSSSMIFHTVNIHIHPRPNFNQTLSIDSSSFQLSHVLSQILKLILTWRWRCTWSEGCWQNPRNWPECPPVTFSPQSECTTTIVLNF